MRLDGQLNLVVTLKTDDDGNGTLFAYSIPITREVFEGNYRIISGVYAEIFGRGKEYVIASGPRVAALALKDAGEREVEGTDLPNPALALIEEIKRLTSICGAGPKGWEALPVDLALQRGIMTPEDWGDLEASLVFFTCVCAMTKNADRAKTLPSMASIMDASTTPLNASGFLASLPPLKEKTFPEAAA